MTYPAPGVGSSSVVPAPQCVQFTLGATQPVPGAHAAQLMAPGASATVPLAHGTHV